MACDLCRGWASVTSCPGCGPGEEPACSRCEDRGCDDCRDFEGEMEERREARRLRAEDMEP